MGRERYVVRLEREELDQLGLIRGGKSPARKVARARILLKADTGVMRIVEGWTRLYGVPYQAAVPSEAGRRSPHIRPLDERGEAQIALATRPPQAMTTGPCGSWQTRWWMGLAPSMSPREFASG